MASRTRNLSLTVAVALMAGFTATATAAPAQAAKADSTATATASAQAASSYNFLYFNKNSGNQTKSTLTLYRYIASSDRTVKLDSWRAGSGYTKNTCALNKGWLPNGTYKIPSWHKKFNGTKIKGYVVRLSNKRCHNGTPRTELFIHSEMTRLGYQGSTEPWRWDGPSDYKSNGCVKLHPADIKELFRYGKPTKLIVG
ncbi:L,D-transpeptidase family protein [Streptomyces zagrosensis]|uniref:Lipoprotein-anchoring transpeptidase ErfK/SrfK n=1 Tax=Streptomyces zagrosensis TaxID=1042984 RepID=A0A7W9QAP5_9ACTN|nr:L,D-transpeptidase [Streptomyces zagrosensis]MBB5935542.1 lipoprotein-anchoring transpeptidase ErfK/SrfK [Streptomyces zagrosensis]